MKNKKIGGRYVTNQSISLRVTAEEKNRLMEFSALIGASLSEYLRHRIFGGRPILPRTDEWAIRELRRMGGLLKHNFETLRQAKMEPDFIFQHEELLQTIAIKIEKLGEGNHDSKED